VKKCIVVALLSLLFLLSGCMREDVSYAPMDSKENIQSIAIYNIPEAIEYNDIRAFSDPVVRIEPTRHQDLYEDIQQLPFGNTRIMFFGHNLSYRNYVVEIIYADGHKEYVSVYFQGQYDKFDECVQWYSYDCIEADWDKFIQKYIQQNA
jgi:hypothetical protein